MNEHKDRLQKLKKEAEQRIKHDQDLVALLTKQLGEVRSTGDSIMLSELVAEGGTHRIKYYRKRYGDEWYVLTLKTLMSEGERAIFGASMCNWCLCSFRFGDVEIPSSVITDEFEYTLKDGATILIVRK